MALFEREPGPWLRPVKDHLLSLVIDGELAPDDKESAIRIARQFVENDSNNHKGHHHAEIE